MQTESQDRSGSNERQSDQQPKNSTYDPDLKKWLSGERTTLSVISKVLSGLPKLTEPSNGSLLQRQFIRSIFLDFTGDIIGADMIERLRVINDKYRNPAAHIETFEREQADACLDA